MRRQAYVSRMRQPALIRRARLGLTQTAPRPVPADRPGPCLLRVDQARHGPVHLLDAAGHYRRHGWLRGAADRRLRPALQQRQPCRQGGVRPSRLQLNGFFLAQLAIGSPRSRRHHQRVHGRISPVHLRRRPATRCHARRQGGGLWRRRRRGRDHLLVRGVFTGQAILSAKDLETRIGTPGVIRSVIGTGLYPDRTRPAALGLGTLIRRIAGAITALIGLVLILPVLVQGLPAHGRPTSPNTCTGRRAGHHRPHQIRSGRPPVVLMAASRCSAPMPPPRSPPPPSC